MLLAKKLELCRLNEDTTKGRLIATCEQLLGEHGFGEVALHDIAHEAGQSNKYAVQYHFGGKEQLIEAVFSARYQFIIKRRTELLQIAGSKGLLGSTEAVLEIIYLPIAEQVDANGAHSFARFWLQFFTRPDSSGISANPFKDNNPLFNHLLDLLAASLRRPRAPVESQLQLLGFLNFAALIDRDNRRRSGKRQGSLAATVNQTIELIAAALKGSKLP